MSSEEKKVGDVVLLYVRSVYPEPGVCFWSNPVNEWSIGTDLVCCSFPLQVKLQIQLCEP